MYQVILMTIQHPFDDLLKKSLTGILVESSSLYYVVKELSSLKKLHDDCNLHIFKSKTVKHFYNVIMAKGL